MISPQAQGGGTPATGADTDQLQTLGGGGAIAGVGDAISATDDGLDEPYRFHVEVPPGATDLQIDIFDADVYMGGAADDSGERDQNRNSVTGTNARYRLFDPDGNLVATRFTLGDLTNPLSSDDAWINFYDSDTAGVTGGDTFQDNFETVAYNNNDGSVNFGGIWIESNTGGNTSPSTGDIIITGGALRLSNASDSSPFINEPALERALDLSSYSAAVVTFDYTTGSGTDIISASGPIGDSFSFDASSDGGTTWETLGEVADATGVVSGSLTYDLSNHLTSTARIRLRITNRYAAASEFVDIDNFQIRANMTANGADPAAGHWLVEVDMSSDVNGRLAGASAIQRQDDVNAFGLRAHDGTPGSGGTEYNLYADSFVIVGINNNDSFRDYELYPYVTLGCDADIHDFDFDNDQPNPGGANPNTVPFGTIDLTSRTTNFTHSNSAVSDDDMWFDANVTTWSTDDAADDYGIWLMDVRIEDWDQNNYGPIYMTDENGTVAPPSASPEPDSFRIYLPTDAGTAPIKPYVGHFLNYVDDQSSGPNPPGVGQTSRFAVSVVVDNPTGSLGDITFSASNVVTAHIPAGAETAYGGIAFITGGTVLTQPAVAATTGDITWNPGTISPGDSESLVYYIDITPAAVADIVVTGISGTGNGTRATFLDETGDQTFTFGELCRLVMSSSAVTPVLVSDFSTKIVDETTVVEWQTAAEPQTVGMDLYRLDVDGHRTKINEETLLPLLGKPQGGTYRLADPDAPLDQESIYVLEETESTGNKKTHGPFYRRPEFAADGVKLPDGLDRTAHPTPAPLAERLADSRQAELDAIPEAPENNGTSAAIGQLSSAFSLSRIENALRVGVDRTGIYRISAQELATAFGVDLRVVQSLLTRNQMRLTLQGEEVAWRKIGRGQALELYGEAIDSPFTPTQIYRLEAARGTVIAEPGLHALAPDWSGDTFEETVRIEESELPVVLLDLDPEADHWFWGFVSAQAATRDFDFSVADPAGDAGADLTVDLQGAADREHQVVIRWNGQELGQTTVSGTETSSVTFALPAGAVLQGGNTLQAELLGGGLVFVDGFDLTYERRLTPTDNALIVRGLDAQQLSASPFSDGKLRVFDLADPLNPRLLAARSLPEAGGYRAIWQGRRGGPFLVTADAGLLTPTLELDVPSDLRSTARAADYLVITTADMLVEAQVLADYRSGQGMTTLVVDVQDVYDEFAHGLRDVRAIRDFLAYAHEQWQGAPRFVLLAGAGTYDYHDHYGLGGNRIPTLLASNGDSLYSSDTALADFDGNGVPEMAIGRIPALVAAELASYVAKIQAYETASDDAWQSRLQILSDLPENDTSFSQTGTALSALLPEGFETTRIDLEGTDLDAARQTLFEGLNDGQAWMHYTGHGGVDRMSSLGLMTSADAQTLSNAVLPIVSSITCHINHHSLPGFDSLGEYLVLQDGGGAAAVFAPTWLSRHGQASLIGDRLFRQVFQRQSAILGEAILAALNSAAGAGIPADVIGTYQLLGDPALRVKILANPDTGDTCEPNCSGPG